MDAQSPTFRNTRKLYSSLPMQEIQVHILSRLLAARSCQALAHQVSRARPGKFSLGSRRSPTQIPEGALRNRRDRLASKYHTSATCVGAS